VKLLFQINIWSNLKGQLCLSDLSSGFKKYKLRITRDEYHTNSRQLNLVKHEISYESDWFEIKDELGSPFYREQNNNGLCLYSNKCWIDLKLYPNLKSARLKLIYLTMLSENLNHSRMPTNGLKNNSNNNNNSELSQQDDMKVGDIWTRILSIQSKFVIKNKTSFDLRAKIVNSHASLDENRVHRFLDTEARKFAKKSEYHAVDMILNMGNYYLKEQDQKIEEYDALKVYFLLCLICPL
jgi:hypothetical protein